MPLSRYGPKPRQAKTQKGEYIRELHLQAAREVPIDKNPRSKRQKYIQRERRGIKRDG